MAAEFETALDAREIVDALYRRLNKLPYNAGLTQLAKNISNMVSELSRLEASARNVRNVRNHSLNVAVRRHKDSLADAITRLDDLLLIAQIMA